MSNLPDVRSKVKKSVFKGTQGDKADSGDMKNMYYHGYLNDRDAMYIHGHDVAAENAENAFNNFDVYAGELERFGIDPDDVDLTELLKGKWMEDYTDEEIESLSQSTKIAIAMRDVVLSSMEMDRNDAVIGCIESMDEDELAQLSAKADAGEYKNVIIRAEEQASKELNQDDL